MSMLWKCSALWSCCLLACTLTCRLLLCRKKAGRSNQGISRDSAERLASCDGM